MLSLNLQCISLLVLSFSKELSIQVGRPLTVLWRSLRSSRPALRTFFLYQTTAEAQQKSSVFLVCSLSCKKHKKESLPKMSKNAGYLWGCKLLLAVQGIDCIHKLSSVAPLLEFQYVFRVCRCIHFDLLINLFGIWQAVLQWETYGHAVYAFQVKAQWKHWQ